jgi:hypothetical protein
MLSFLVLLDIQLIILVDDGLKELARTLEHKLMDSIFLALVQQCHVTLHRFSRVFVIGGCDIIIIELLEAIVLGHLLIIKYQQLENAAADCLRASFVINFELFGGCINYFVEFGLCSINVFAHSHQVLANIVRVEHFSPELFLGILFNVAWTECVKFELVSLLDDFDKLAWV